MDVQLESLDGGIAAGGKLTFRERPSALEIS